MFFARRRTADPVPSSPVGPRRVKVLNLITKLTMGGAQETALRYCSLLDPERFETLLVTGPDTGVQGDLHERASELGVRVVVVPELHRPIRPVADARALVALVRLFRRERPDIVHTHSSKAGLMGRLAARLAGITGVVHTVHGWSFHDGMGRIVRASIVWAERLAARWTSALVVVAEQDRAYGQRCRVGRPDQYVLIRSAIELDLYRPEQGRREHARHRLGLPPDVPVVGAVTRLFPQKDPLTLVRCAQRVAAAVPDVHVVVIGDGPMRDEVEALIDDLGLRSHISLLGWQTDVSELYAGFDVVLSTALWEGLPRVVVEAAAARVPVVATDVGGTSEVVVDRRSGLLARPGDVAGLADAVVRVLTSPTLATELSEGAAAQVEDFDVAAMAQGLERLYERVMIGRSRPRRFRISEATPSDSGQEAA